MAMTSLDDEPLSNTLRPLTDATITVRVIKSFEYRTLRGLVLQHVDLTSLTVGELKDRVRKGASCSRSLSINAALRRSAAVMHRHSDC